MQLGWRAEAETDRLMQEEALRAFNASRMFNRDGTISSPNWRPGRELAARDFKRINDPRNPPEPALFCVDDDDQC